jgi:OFA family oxalate/formate antiporter-like MFS transporter
MKPTLKRGIRGGVGTLLMLFLGSLYAWSFFKVALGKAYPHWSQTGITLNFTLMMSFFCLGGVLAGSILKTLPKSRQIIIAAALVFAGFLGVSFLPTDSSNALIQLYLCYGVLNGLGTGIAYNAVLSGIQPWFPDRPGLISGVLLMGMGLGALILGNIASVLIGMFGLFFTFRIFAFAMAAVLLVCAPIICVPSANDSLPIVNTSEGSDSYTKDYTTAEMLKRPTFWIYFIWNILVSSGGMLVINSASSISVYFGLAAVIGLVVSVFNGGGRLIIGLCMDKLGWKGTMYLNNAVLLVSGGLLFIGDRGHNGIIVLLGMLIMGICYGGGITISAALIRKLYGSKYFASNFSVCNLCLIPASIIGPIVSAMLVDAAGGGYTTTFRMVIVLGIITLILNTFIRKP